MQQSSVKIGNFQVAVTPSLRELFSHTHAEMSGSEAADQQYPSSEQYEMYLACEVPVKGDKHKIDPEKTEDNLLELLHFLTENGVPVPEIIGAVRCFGPRTRGVSLRLHLHEVRTRKAEEKQEQERNASMPLFLAPALQVAVA